jgi:hypothetical protein
MLVRRASTRRSGKRARAVPHRFAAGPRRYRRQVRVRVRVLVRALVLVQAEQ